MITIECKSCGTKNTNGFCDICFKIRKTRIFSWHNARINRKSSVFKKGSLPAYTVYRLYKKQKGLCACCNELLLNEYHLDHKQPLCKGGLNNIKNVQLLKPKCHMLKGKLSLKEWKLTLSKQKRTEKQYSMKSLGNYPTIKEALNACK